MHIDVRVSWNELKVFDWKQIVFEKITNIHIIIRSKIMFKKALLFKPDL